MRSVPRSSPPAHMHHPSLSLPLPLLPPPAYSSHGVKGTTSRAISGSRTPTVQTLGVIKRRREIEIGNRGRRGGLMSCRNTEGIKNEAALLFLLFFSLFFWSELCLSLHLALNFLLLFSPQLAFLVIASAQSLIVLTEMQKKDSDMSHRRVRHL